MINEDIVIDNIKGILASENFNYKLIFNALTSVPTTNKRILLEDSISQSKYEQKMRRDYIAHNLFNNTALIESAKQDILCSLLADSAIKGSIGQLLSSLSISTENLKIQNGQISQELLNQAKLFSIIKNNMDTLYKEAILRKIVSPISANLNSLANEKLDLLASEASKYIQDIKKDWEDNPGHNPNLPESLTKHLAEASMDIGFRSRESVAEKINRLFNIIVIAKAIINSRKNKLYNNLSDLEMGISEFLYLQGTPIDLVD